MHTKGGFPDVMEGGCKWRSREVGTGRFIALACLMILGWFGGFQGCTQKGQKVKRPETSVVLISLDTLRADHLGCYEYPKDTSPQIDALAEQGALFRRAFAQAPATLISHSSIMTSLIPRIHEADWSESRPLARRFTTLPERLKQKGYQTAAFTGGVQLDKLYGLHQGFDTYFDGGEFRITHDDKIDIEILYEKTLEWLESKPDGPFFLFFHTYQVHAPYRPPAPFDEMFNDPSYQGGSDGEQKTLDRINEGKQVLEIGH